MDSEFKSNLTRLTKTMCKFYMEAIKKDNKSFLINITCNSCVGFALDCS